MKKLLVTQFLVIVVYIFNRKNDKNRHAFPLLTNSHSPITSSPKPPLTNPLLTNPKQYCSHRDLNPGLLTSQLTCFSTRPLVSCFTKTKKSIFKIVLMEQSLFCFLQAKIEWSFIVYQNNNANLCNDQLQHNFDRKKCLD